jgi:hypothetical protein
MIKLTKKLYYRPSAWPYQNYQDILITCYTEDRTLEARLEMHDFKHNGEVSVQLCIFTESFDVLPLLTAALLTLPDPTNEDKIVKSLEELGFTDGKESE